MDYLAEGDADPNLQDRVGQLKSLTVSERSDSSQWHGGNQNSVTF